jgi:hypothetical protein
MIVELSSVRVKGDPAGARTCTMFGRWALETELGRLRHRAHVSCAEKVCWHAIASSPKVKAESRLVSLWIATVVVCGILRDIYR